MKKVLIPALILIVAVVVVLIVVLNFSKTPILLGIVGTYSGKTSDHGISVRNGILMAFEEINDEGGIDGYEIELVTVDDENDPEKIKAEVDKLLEKDITAILGPVTSGMAAEIVDKANDSEVLMIGPTVSSNIFTGLDDYLIRVVTPSKALGKNLANYIVENTGLEKVLAFYDKSNEEYCLDILNEFKANFNTNGYQVIEEIAFDSNDVDYNALVEKVKEYNPDAVIFIASAGDVASFAQNVRAEGLDTQLIATGWAKQIELIENGGEAVEGMLLGANFDESIQVPEFLEFRENYNEKYGKDPNFGAVYGYEIASIVINTLKNNANVKKDNIKEIILEEGDFPGLMGDIEFDEYGDVDRDMYIVTIEDGQFKTLE